MFPAGLSGLMVNGLVYKVCMCERVCTCLLACLVIWLAAGWGGGGTAKAGVASPRAGGGAPTVGTWPAAEGEEAGRKGEVYLHRGQQGVFPPQ